jgi:protoheme ferro-lyase
MEEYCKELENLIIDTLLPAYLEHYRLLGRPSPLGEINTKLLSAMRKKKKIAALLRANSY